MLAAKLLVQKVIEWFQVRAWIIPEDFDPSDAEAKHLINESDSDADGKLTKDEILDKYDLFVGSQATDFGEALSRHDEFWGGDAKVKRMVGWAGV